MDLSGSTRIGLGRTAEVYAWGEGRVLKLFHDWVPEDWVEHERRNTAAAHAAGAPAPALLGSEVVGGRRGLVLERVEGPSLLQVLQRQPWRVIAAGRCLAEVQAALHRLPAPATGVETVGRRLRREIARSDLPAAVRQRAEDALARLGADRPLALCHGDVHPDNVILSPRGPVILDWMNAAAGPPLADVARASLVLRVGVAPEGAAGGLLSLGRGVAHRAYLRRYLQLTGASRAELDAWALPVGVARAAERIEDERAALLALVERWVA